MPKADIAVLLALGAALVSALGSVIRQRSAHEIVDKPVGAWALFLLSLRDTRWWLGAAAAVANYALQAAALSLGSVMLVTALQVTVLLFALPINARMTGAPGDRVGMVLGGGAGRRGGGRSSRSAIRWPDQQRASLHTWAGGDLGDGPGIGVCACWARESGRMGRRRGAAGAGGRCVAGAVRGADQGCRRGGRRRHRGACCARPNCMPGSPLRWPAWCSSRRHFAPAAHGLVADDDVGQTDGRMDLGNHRARRERCSVERRDECSSWWSAVIVMIVSTVALARGEADNDGGVGTRRSKPPDNRWRRRPVSLMAC